MSERIKAGLKLAGMFTCLWLVTNVFSFDTTTVLLYVAAFGTSTVYLVSNRATIIAFVRAWPSSFAGSVVVFYICKILVEKIINSSMGIEVDYLRHASIVGGFLLSVPVSLMVVSLYLFLRSAYQKCREPFTQPRGARLTAPDSAGSAAEHTAPEHFPGLRPMFAATLLMLATFIFFHADAGIRFVVMLDSMMYSDCGPPQPEIGYVRKNANACYRFDTRIFHGSLVPTEIASRKPG